MSIYNNFQTDKKYSLSLRSNLRNMENGIITEKT